LDANCLTNRNTFVRAFFDERERLRVCEKVVYGEVEVRHVYDYHETGKLRTAIITVDDEQNTLSFDEDGARV
jgi:Family of unknown function (DUF6156)